MKLTDTAAFTGRKISLLVYILSGIGILCAASLIFVKADSLLSRLCLLVLIMSVILGMMLHHHIVSARLTQYDVAMNMLCSMNTSTSLKDSNRQPLNILIDDLCYNLQKDYTWQLSQKQTTLNALQSQINPHFLYNTLDCIRGQALDHDMDEIASMVEALSSIFRYSISITDTLVPLRDEIHNIQTYFTIQQYRFKNRFLLCINCEDERALNFYLPKLTLQPLVENSIFHGLELMQGGGRVDINITLTEKRLLITVTDDGCGMAPDDLLALQNKLSSPPDYSPDPKLKHGIALRNLNRRIKLLFGPDYGIFVSSQLNCGTEIEIVIPAIDRKPEDISGTV